MSEKVENVNERGTCCFCGFDCNPLSQTCGPCARLSSMGNFFELKKRIEIEKVFLDIASKGDKKKNQTVEERLTNLRSNLERYAKLNENFKLDLKFKP